MEVLFAGFGLFFIVFVIIGLLTTLLPIVLIVLAVRKANFQNQALNNLDKELRDDVAHAPQPDRQYIKTQCDNCGAKCRDLSDLSPSGDIRCKYCGQWFNILRPTN